MLDEAFKEKLRVYHENINKELLELAPKITEVAAQPATEEIWAVIGDLHYGHPVTPLILRYRALMWMAKHPPDPRGQKFCSRPGPYTVYVRKDDLAEALDKSPRTIDRMLADVREAFGQKPYSSITVEHFCWTHELNEDTIQRQLHEVLVNRWNKPKKKSK